MEKKDNMSAGLQEISDIFDYLDALKMLKENADYLTIFAVKDTAGHEFSEEMFLKMKDLGLKESLVDKYRRSYIGVVDSQRNLYEILEAKGRASEVSLCVGGHNIHVISRTYTNGNGVLISLDEMDYAVGSRGLNIVVVEKKTMTVIDSVGFDTNTPYAICHRSPEHLASRGHVQSQLTIIENNLTKKIDLLEERIAELGKRLDAFLDNPEKAQFDDESSID